MVSATLDDPTALDTLITAGSATETQPLTVTVTEVEQAPVSTSIQSFELSSLAGGDGSTGFVIEGIDAHDNSGHSVSGAGDVNGDGYADLIIGAPGAGPNDSDDNSDNRGESYLLFGGPTLGGPLQIISSATVSIAENSTGVVRNIEASLNGGAADAGIRYSLTGGADQALFTINENNGEFSFIDVPDFENPLDADTDNIYQATVTATATAGVETTRQNLTVTVTNENDAPTSSSSPTDDASAATARNFESGDASGPDTSTVVFDLTSGLSSDHSSQTFSPNITYSLYIKVDSDSNAVSLNADEGWSGANHLGSDDQIILVGDGAAILGREGNAVTRNSYSTSGAYVGAYGWFTENDAAAALTAGGEFNRVFAAEQNSVDLWDGMPLPDAEADLLSLSHLTALPDSVSLPIL